MLADKSVPLPPPPLVLVSCDVPRVSHQLKGRRPNDEGCPNESLSADDDTGYSPEKEEA